MSRRRHGGEDEDGAGKHHQLPPKPVGRDPVVGVEDRPRGAVADEEARPRLGQDVADNDQYEPGQGARKGKGQRPPESGRRDERLDAERKRKGTDPDRPQGISGTFEPILQRLEAGDGGEQ